MWLVAVGGAISSAGDSCDGPDSHRMAGVAVGDLSAAIIVSVILLVVIEARESFGVVVVIVVDGRFSIALLSVIGTRGGKPSTVGAGAAAMPLSSDLALVVVVVVVVALAVLVASACASLDRRRFLESCITVSSARDSDVINVFLTRSLCRSRSPLRFFFL